MTGLIYKDFLALKGHLTTYLVFFLVYGGLCLSGVFTASVLCGMVVLMSLITPMTTVTSDDVSRWNRFAIATPACRRGGGDRQVPVHPAGDPGQHRVCLPAAGRAGPGRRAGGAPVRAAAVRPGLCGDRPDHERGGAPPAAQVWGGEGPHGEHGALFTGLRRLCPAGPGGRPGLALPAPPAWVLTALPGLLAILAVGGFALSYCIAQAIYARKEF